MSDLHFEFHRDGGLSFIQSIKPHDTDILVLAGDICSSNQLVGVMTHFCDLYPHVVYVPGNHEYWKTRPAYVRGILNHLSETLRNFYWLDNEARIVDGVHFVGGTMWFPDYGRDAPKHRMSDYWKIKDFTPWVYGEHSKFQMVLRQHVTEHSVVVTHHLPSEKSVEPEHEGNDLNIFFFYPMDEFIKMRKPQAWIHGHSHGTSDYYIGRTHVCCNPFGYVGDELNSNFRDHYVITAGTLPHAQGI